MHKGKGILNKDEFLNNNIHEQICNYYRLLINN